CEPLGCPGHHLLEHAEVNGLRLVLMCRAGFNPGRYTRQPLRPPGVQRCPRLSVLPLVRISRLQRRRLVSRLRRIPANDPGVLEPADGGLPGANCRGTACCPGAAKLMPGTRAPRVGSRSTLPLPSA